MYFEYAQYVRGCLILPLLISLSALYILLAGILQLINVINQRKFSTNDIVNFLIAVLLSSFFLSMNVGRLLNGGIHLIYEREADVVELNGEILEINELDRYSFPEFKNEYGYGEKNGVQLIIDGVKCTAITRGTLEVGDNVTVTLLPQSGYILFIDLDNVE